jgi:nucleoside-diphosphate-sugar epimerase
MVGNGRNVKSMCYVGNIVAFIRFLIESPLNPPKGDFSTAPAGGNAGGSTPLRGAGGLGSYNVFNYIDKPDLTTNELVCHVSHVLQKHIPTTHFPLWLGMLGGYGFDLLAKILRRKLIISSVRVKKFCATTQFDATKVHASGFTVPFTLREGLERTLRYEFQHGGDGVTFVSE